ncbi:hypothetical protein NX059_001867 [Plenodomus lindquistii]|nr:hypothetical protein NX059_001867 [Plenodomus lindquistii]
MSTQYLSVEDLAPLTHYSRPEPLYVFFAMMFCYFLGSLIQFIVARLCSCLRSPANATTQTFINALDNKNHPIHHYLQAHIHRSVNASVKEALQAMEDRVVKKVVQAQQDKIGEVIEIQFTNEVVVRAIEQELKELRDMVSGRQQSKIGPRNKLRIAMSNLQASMSEGTTHPTDHDDLLDPPITPPSLSPFSSSTSSPAHSVADHHESDSDSIYGSDSGQPAQAQAEPPQMSKDFDDELAALAGYESEGAGSASELDSDVDAEGETDDEYVAPSVKPAPIVQLPGLGNSVKRQIKPLYAMKTKGTRR